MANPVVPARGMRDILPSEKKKRDAVLQIIRDTYRKNGFSEIETPAVEPLTRLLSNQGGENEKMIFEILRRGLPGDQPVLPKEATDLGLRYDLTVPLTRFYATHVNELPRVFRALQTGPVWRAERPQKGRYRQFRQCDIDIIGDDSSIAEIDLLSTTLAAFEALGMSEDIKLLINDRRILTDLLSACAVPADKYDETLIVLDKMDKVGPAGVKAELLAKELLSESDADRLLELTAQLRDQGGLDDEPLRNGVITSTDGQEISMRDLPQIAAAVKQLVPWATIEFDATLVRGMGYYTGPIFEVTHKSANFSVAGGGRYDHVVGKWLGREVPACGFSIGFERIIDLVNIPATEQEKVALFYKGNTDAVALLTLRQQLQDQGASVVLVVPPRRLGGQFFDELVEQGFTHSLDGRSEQANVADKKELHRG